MNPPKIVWLTQNLLPSQVLVIAACDDSNSASKPASNSKGDRQLSKRAEVEAVIQKFVEALNIDDASIVPLSKHVEYHGFAGKDS